MSITSQSFGKSDEKKSAWNFLGKTIAFYRKLKILYFEEQNKYEICKGIIILEKVDKDRHEKGGFQKRGETKDWSLQTVSEGVRQSVSQEVDRIPNNPSSPIFFLSPPWLSAIQEIGRVAADWKSESWDDRLKDGWNCELWNDRTERNTRTARWIEMTDWLPTDKRDDELLDMQTVWIDKWGWAN